MEHRGDPLKEALCSSLPSADNHIIPEGVYEDQTLSLKVGLQCDSSQTLPNIPKENSK